MRLLSLALRRETAMPVLALTFASAASVALVVARIISTGNLRYCFLVWNLFLAWLPLVFALLASEKYRARLGPRLAFPRPGRGVAAVLPQRALHLHRFDSPDARASSAISGWT